MAKMNVTRVKIRMNEKDKSAKIKAYATVVLNDFFRISGIKVLDSDNGLWMAFPSFQTSDGRFQDLVSTVDREGRKLIQEQVLNAFHAEVIASAA